MNCNEILKSGIWKLIFSLNVKENESSKKLSRRVFMEIPKFLKNSVQKKKKKTIAIFALFNVKMFTYLKKLNRRYLKKKKSPSRF